MSAFFGAGSRAQPAAVAADRSTQSIAAPSANGGPGDTLLVMRSPVRVPAGGSVTLRYAYGAAAAGRVPALVARYRASADPLRASEAAWAGWLPQVSFGRRPWLARELEWDAYMVRSGATYEEACGHHILSQGGYYQYALGFQGAYRDPLQHMLPMIYADPELAREVLLYSAQEQTRNGSLPYSMGGLCRPNAGGSDDLDLWLMLAASEYSLGARDLGFLHRRVRFADGGSATLWDHLKLAYAHQESQRGPHGGYLAGPNGDWSDFSSIFLGMTESTLVTAQLAYVYPQLAAVAGARGDGAFAGTLRERARALRSVLVGQWTGRGWYSRGYAGERQLGSGAIFGEPQPWAILAGVSTPARARTLVANIRRFLTGVGAPAQVHGPSRIGSSLTPARNDPARQRALEPTDRRRRQQRKLRRRHVVRRERLAGLGAVVAGAGRAGRRGVRLGRVHPQHPGPARDGLSAPLERDHLGRRRLLVVLLVAARPLRCRFDDRLRHADPAPARVEPVRRDPAGRNRAHGRRLPHPAAAAVRGASRCACRRSACARPTAASAATSAPRRPGGSCSGSPCRPACVPPPP